MALNEHDIVSDGSAKFEVVKNATSHDIKNLQKQIDDLKTEIEALKKEGN